MADHIVWLGHASFKFTGARTIYVDPWKLPPDSERADLVLVTHEHRDHFSKPDIAIISKEGTVVVGPPSVTSQLGPDAVTARVGDVLDVADVRIEVVPAYNPAKNFHPKSAGHVGYIVTVEGKRIYHAGDTDVIPEMTEFHPDIALLPVSGKYVMTGLEAAEAARLIQPQLAIPMHFGDPDVVGTLADAEQFKEHAGVPVEIPVRSGA